MHINGKSQRLFGAALTVLLIAALAPLPLTAQAEKGGKGGGGGGNREPFRVVFSDDFVVPYQTPTYLPFCPGAQSTSKKIFSIVLLPRHDLCATVNTSTGALLTDDIGVTVRTNRQGQIISLQLHGQDVIGEEGIMHESEEVFLDMPVTPLASGFTLHVHADSVPIWKLSGHLRGDRVEVIGNISIADISYIPQ